MDVGKRFGARLDSIAGAVTDKARGYAAVTSAMMENVGTDLKALAAAGEERLMQSIDTVLGDEKLGGLVQTVRQYGVDGYDRVKEALQDKAKAYDAYMDGVAKKRADLAGLSDGFLSIYLNTPCDRKPRSKVYKAHVTYGKAIGVVSAVAFLTGTKTYQKVLGALPLITRGAEYLKQKFYEAQAQVKEVKAAAH